MFDWIFGGIVLGFLGWFLFGLKKENEIN